jgi:hypothetical protein
MQPPLDYTKIIRMHSKPSEEKNEPLFDGDFGAFDGGFTEEELQRSFPGKIFCRKVKVCFTKETSDWLKSKGYIN